MSAGHQIPLVENDRYGVLLNRRWFGVLAELDIVSYDLVERALVKLEMCKLGYSKTKDSRFPNEELNEPS